MKRTNNGYLIQARDEMTTTEKELEYKTKKHSENTEELLFAWKICRHVKSNAIVLAKDGATLGWARQMSRVDALDCA
jgi:phosphoribosylaminoimidazolecarboxamide formyltransferase/IMP cyclohydrolase